MKSTTSGKLINIVTAGYYTLGVKRGDMRRLCLMFLSAFIVLAVGA